jgi:hypothetical protein
VNPSPSTDVATPGPEKRAQPNPKPEVLRVLLSLACLLYLVGIIVFPGMGRLGVPEAVIFGAILLLNSGVLAKLGEVSISAKGIALKMDRVEQKQLDQQAQINALYFLISAVATELEVEYLQKLAGDGYSDYDNGDEEHHEHFRAEIRRLRGRNLIEMVPTKTVREMPVKGNLKDHCRITAHGRMFLSVRKQFDRSREEALAL